ncbi:unnamed protein product [Caenorhabditis bovis]|uniref:Conserved oligomeric Golgi complex subunit 6 n=1 Tax=Caenorhabditis bovis TaxID=2654633 RepID=A0A8S1EAX4_9PELO|nr:unnamed protein product [Caenorhabditis bovis]
MMETNTKANILQKKIVIAVSKDVSNETLEIANYVAPFAKNLELNNRTEQKICRKLEKRDIDLNNEYLVAFEKINQLVQRFDDIAHGMNKICLRLYENIEKTKMKNWDLVQKSVDLYQKHQRIESKYLAINDFLENFSMDTQDLKELENCEQNGFLNDAFFTALEKAKRIHGECRTLVQEEGHVAAFEIMENMQLLIENAYLTICENLKRVFRQISADSIQKKSLIIKAFQELQSNPIMVKVSLEQYADCRAHDLLGQFVNSHRKSLDSGTTTIGYVGDLITSIHNICANENELLKSLLSSCDPELFEKYGQSAINEATKVLATPFKVRVESALGSETDPIVICSVANMLYFYKSIFENLLQKKNHISEMLDELSKTGKEISIAGINYYIDVLTAKMCHPPSPDLIPSREINQCLGFLKQLISCLFDLNANNSGLFDVKNIFALVLDPLLREVQVNSSMIKENLDAAIFTINCLTTIRNSIREHPEIADRLEMIDAMIESNSDVLVSMKASQILSSSGLFEIYKKMQDFDNSGKMPEFSGLQPFTVSAAIVEFTHFLNSDASAHDFDLCEKILAENEREAIRNRTATEFLKIYEFIINNLENEKNGYKGIHYLPLDGVKQLL